MSAKKEWQAAMESMKKEVMDGMQEYFDKMMSKLDEKEANIKDTMKEILTKEIGEITKQIGNMDKEIKGNTEKIQGLETQTEQTNKKLEELSEENEKLQILLEAKPMDRQIRLRGIKDEKDEDTYQKMATILIEFLEKPEEEIKQSLDLAYRVNSAFATSKKLPMDVIIQLTTIRKKEEILKRQFDTPMEIDNRKILILKEVLKKVLTKRKKYKELIEYLKKKNISYRWELPEGVSFLIRGKRLLIKTTEQMEEFMEQQKMAEDRGKHRTKVRDGK